MIEWKVLIVSQNEEERIQLCIRSVCAALKDQCAEISVLVNQCQDNTLDASCQESKLHHDTSIKVFYIDYGDKSNAINQFLYASCIYTPSKYYAFIDGHICVAPDLFDRVADHFNNDSELLCVSGAADNGRTSAMLSRHSIRNGAVYGQCFVLKGEFVSRLRSKKFKLPIGLYRGDGLIGSMVAHNLDAVNNEWSNSRSIVAQNSKYTIETLSIFSFRALVKQFRRMIRQSRGTLENWAIKTIIYKENYSSLPEYADDMLRQQDINGWPATPKRQLPFRWLALYQFRQPKSKPTTPMLEPKLVFTNK